MTAAPPTRPITEAERALVDRLLGADRAVSLGAVLLAAGLGVVLPGVVLSHGEVGAAVLLTSIALVAVLVFWKMTWEVRQRRVTTPARAVRLEGPVGKEGWDLGDIQTTNRPSVGGQAMALPDHWCSYLVEGTSRAAWVVETTGLPVAVAIERGPSADADAALDADRLQGMRSRPGAWLLIALGLAALVVLAAFEIGPGSGVRLTVKATLATAAVMALVVVARDVRRRGRLHGAYFEAGARHALSPSARRRYRVRQAALYGLSGGAAGVLGVAVGLHRGADPIAFVALVALVGAAVAPLPNDEPDGDPSNSGTGALRPAAP